jgi:hypothetical protein
VCRCASSAQDFVDAPPCGISDGRGYRDDAGRELPRTAARGQRCGGGPVHGTAPASAGEGRHGTTRIEATAAWHESGSAAGGNGLRRRASVRRFRA